MISFISGTVTESGENSLIIECNGIGYEILASAKTLDKKGNIGEKVTVFTYMCVREDSLTLYGFHSNEERTMFLKLINVSGIGPKVALSILSGLSVDDLIACIVTGDGNRLNQIKGVGKKTAERIVLELKDKVSMDMAAPQTVLSSLAQDAVLGLISMGFSKLEASNLVAKVYKEGMPTEQIILNALKA